MPISQSDPFRGMSAASVSSDLAPVRPRHVNALVKRLPLSIESLTDLVEMTFVFAAMLEQTGDVQNADDVCGALEVAYLACDSLYAVTDEQRDERARDRADDARFERDREEAVL